MQRRRTRSLIVITMVGALALAACGSDEEDTASTEAATEATEAATEATEAATEETEAATEETEAATEETTATEETEAATEETTAMEEMADWEGVCPSTIVLQTDWNPEAEHGWLYELIGDDYVIDKDKVSVSGSLVDSAGMDLGVDVEVRSGGPAIGYQTVTSQMYQDDSILAGFVYTDEAIQNSAEFPTVAVMSGFEKNPQMIMWDPATYPDVKTIEDIGTAGILVRYFSGAAWMDYYTSQGILSADQVDGSYDGTPALFVADEGKSAQQGFGSAEPFIYENEIPEWGQPIAYAYINDAGWENYAQSIAAKPETIETYGECFKLLVPALQQASVDYLADPAETNALIVEAVETFDNGWVYSAGVADFGVQTILADGLQANGTDGVFGSFDMDRVSGLIEKAIPVYESLGQTPKEGLTPEDIVTNEFLDPTIALP